MVGRSPAPDCILYNELVRTSKLYVRDVSVIEASWLSELSPRFFSSVVTEVTTRQCMLPGDN